MERELDLTVFDGPRPSSRPKDAVTTDFSVQMRELQSQVREITQTIADMKLSIQQISRLQTQNHDRLQTKIASLESGFSAFIQEVKSKFVQVIGRFTQNKVSDDKVEELIDRHNAVLQNFESRINQLHKLASEQQYKIVASAAMLEEIKRKYF